MRKEREGEIFRENNSRLSLKKLFIVKEQHLKYVQ